MYYYRYIDKLSTMQRVQERDLPPYMIKYTFEDICVFCTESAQSVSFTEALIAFTAMRNALQGVRYSPLCTVVESIISGL